MCSAARDYLQHQRDCDEDEIESAIESLEHEKDREDSQIGRFLNFLDDEALARVRLTITFRIMEAIRAAIPVSEDAEIDSQSEHKLLAEYVNRVITLFESAQENNYSINLTADYGVAAEFNLIDYLSRATFYSCLPVWPEWKTQIFEEKVTNETATSYGVAREVSYRFRVNGQNPEFRMSAFEARLEKIKEDLLGDNHTSLQQQGTIRRRLAELIFLAIVVPRDSQLSLSKETLPASVNQLLDYLQSGRKEFVKNLIENLRNRAASMDKIASSLISIIRTKGQRIISQVQRQSCEQFICVKNSIMEWSRLEGAEPGVRDLLKTAPQRSREQIEWFQHIEIHDTPQTQGILFSVQVTTEIADHDLVIKDAAHQIKAQRSLTEQILQICWVPHSCQKESGKWTYKVCEAAKKARDWVLPAAIQVEYDVHILERPQNERGVEESKQYHAALVTAFVILVYCCLWRIIQRLKQTDNGEQVEFTTLMLRLQETGKGSEDTSGDSYVYAAAQAIESILAEDTPLRMQGIVLLNFAKPPSTAKWIKYAIFDALLSAFPIVISTPNFPTVSKIGLISYATRPCDENSNLNDDEKGYLFLTQSYIATAVKEPFLGYELKAERMQSDVIDSPERFGKQRLVQEEINYLQSQGCEHIILLSHAYAGRRINRAADYNARLTSKEFIEELSQTFPDLTIYTMLRDVFPATRLLPKREQNKAAFEILKASDHTNFTYSLEKVGVRDVIPVYTFATLYTLQEEQRPQSGFCIYFLLSDRRTSNLNRTAERARAHLLNLEQQSSINPYLISVLRGLHFIEAERGAKNGQITPVLDPFSWISPTTIEAAGEVTVLHNRRKGRVSLSYPAVLSRISQVLHRKK